MVCEEASDPIARAGMRSGRKNRYVAGIVTPAQPNYLHGMLEDSTDQMLQAAPPVIGVAASVGGFQAAPQSDPCLSQPPAAKKEPNSASLVSMFRLCTSFSGMSASLQRLEIMGQALPALRIYLRTSCQDSYH